MTFILNPGTDTLWRWAIHEWAQGDDTRVTRLLKQGREPVPGFAREWLADALAGKVKRRRGRRKTPRRASKIWREHEISSHFQIVLAAERLIDAMTEDGDGLRSPTPTERALAAVAQKFNISEDAASHLVFPRKARNSRNNAP
ncbi:MAG: hypothetical protein AB7I32_10965 [Gammaproteobacteria bacterium]